MQRIVNFHEEQISKLTKKEIDPISEVLTTDLKLVSFFGYDILESGKIAQGTAADGSSAALHFLR